MTKLSIKNLAIAAIFLLSLNSCSAQKEVKKTPPNVIVIVADDMNMWSMLKNYAALQTPYLDKLKSESLYFENASCAAPVCIPSRASFFSGISPHKSGAYVNYRGTWEDNMLSDI